MVIVEYWTSDVFGETLQLNQDTYPGEVGWYFEANGILNIGPSWRILASYETDSWVKVFQVNEDED